jgi:hypothetical protein
MKRPPAAVPVSSIERPRGPKSAKAMPKPCFDRSSTLLPRSLPKQFLGAWQQAAALYAAPAPAPGLVNSNINERKGIGTR